MRPRAGSAVWVSLIRSLCRTCGIAGFYLNNDTVPPGGQEPAEILDRHAFVLKRLVVRQCPYACRRSFDSGRVSAGDLLARVTREPSQRVVDPVRRSCRWLATWRQRRDPVVESVGEAGPVGTKVNPDQAVVLRKARLWHSIRMPRQAAHRRCSLRRWTASGSAASIVGEPPTLSRPVSRGGPLPPGPANECSLAQRRRTDDGSRSGREAGPWSALRGIRHRDAFTKPASAHWSATRATDSRSRTRFRGSAALDAVTNAPLPRKRDYRTGRVSALTNSSRCSVVQHSNASQYCSYAEITESP